ncbi:Nucleolar GTP-binding protein 1 [Linum perenne]
MNKPVAIVCNKADLQPLEVLNDEDEKLVVDMKAEALKTLVGQGGHHEYHRKVWKLKRRREEVEENQEGFGRREWWCWVCILPTLKKHYILAYEEWKEDILPEFIDGHNVCDFIDADILRQLEELERI